jgi:Ca2+-binding RTX toxin-like protein
MPSMRGHLIAVAAALLSGALLASPISGSEAESPPETSVFATPPVPSFFNGGIYITGTGFDNSVTASFDGATDEYVVSDPAGVVVQGSSCEQTSATVVTCPNLGEGVTTSLGSGSDRFVADESLEAATPAVQGGDGDDFIEVRRAEFSLLFGDAGDDTLLGGSGGDVLHGGGGLDRLVGRAGRDDLLGEVGADRLVGGDGADRLFAEDGEADTKIQCGGSRKDTAGFDRHLDPKPIGCPRVAKHGTED